MRDLTISQLADILGVEIEETPDSVKEIKRIVIDSRKVEPGDAFIALKGPNYDGHDFIGAAVKKGAAVVVSEKHFEADATMIIVGDSHEAMRKIAKAFLDQVKPLVVGVTGSAGKTTTKEMIYCALNEKYNVHKNHGNLNNDIGLPLTLFELEKEHEIVVLEMGMNSKGEIRLLASIAQPDIAVITNIGESHIGRLGSKENIFSAKMEICETMDETGVLIVNGDDCFLKSLKIKDTAYSKIFAGACKADGNDVCAKDIVLWGKGSRFTIVHEGCEYKCSLNVQGGHNVINALLAFAAALKAGVNPEAAVRGIEKYHGDDVRGAIIEIGEMTLVNDTYNANPSSMSAAIETLSMMAGRKIAVLGDMLELGVYSKEMHMEIGKKAAESGIDILMVTGSYAEEYKRGAEMNGIGRIDVQVFESNDRLAKALTELMSAGDSILFKGSHSTKMDEVYKEILKNA
ncbi:MAG: UDP-N-acetylmuramoyl-tripeptide--D-alanyl-D-alanine ligase [Clostridiales bacterium]|nr:MAG: UDP-N-acetylmuramoyl-tripeptide--D-alanyl-D-alanine ligase [Clostridiales bacterium]